MVRHGGSDRYAGVCTSARECETEVRESIMGWGSRYGSYWAPYVPVAQRKSQAVKQAMQLAKQEKREYLPVKIEGRKIATTFWGQAWCDNLQAYSDFANRLPRGATYVRNGSVVDLVIKPRSIQAIVAGSHAYTVKISIDGVAQSAWNQIKQECSASIESLLDLLAGRFSNGVMQSLTKKGTGLFPSPGEIKMECSCPDYSYCCKHLAAVMYGVGNRLDKQPELLFLLRDVNHQELVSEALADGNLDRELSASSHQDKTLAGVDLGALFGIELDSETVVAAAGKINSAKPPAKRAARTTPQLTGKAKPTVKEATVKKATVKKATVKKVTVKKPTVKKPTGKVATKAQVSAPVVQKVVSSVQTSPKARLTSTPVAQQSPRKKAVAKPKAAVARRTK